MSTGQQRCSFCLGEITETADRWDLHIYPTVLTNLQNPSFRAKYEVQWVLPSQGSIHNPQFTATCIHKYSQRESFLGLPLCVNMHQVLVYNSSLDKWRRLWVKLPDPGLSPGSSGVQVNISSILKVTNRNKFQQYHYFVILRIFKVRQSLPILVWCWSREASWFCCFTSHLQLGQRHMMPCRYSSIGTSLVIFIQF